MEWQLRLNADGGDRKINFHFGHISRIDTTHDTMLIWFAGDEDPFKASRDNYSGDDFTDFCEGIHKQWEEYNDYIMKNDRKGNIIISDESV